MESHETQLHVFESVKTGDHMKCDPLTFRVLSNPTVWRVRRPEVLEGLCTY